jgi:hypothetical protein
VTCSLATTSSSVVDVQRQIGNRRVCRGYSLVIGYKEDCVGDRQLYGRTLLCQRVFKISVTDPNYIDQRSK